MPGTPERFKNELLGATPAIELALATRAVMDQGRAILQPGL
jgi:hypothetical protein